MLTEEALILLATIVASGLLVLGIIEVAWPARPRHVPQRFAESAVTRSVAMRHAEAAPEPATTAEPPRVARAPDDDVPASLSPRSMSDETRPHVLPLEACRAMYEEGRFADVVSLGSAALELHGELAAMSHRPEEAKALADLVGLARRSLGDPAARDTALDVPGDDSMPAEWRERPRDQVSAETGAEIGQLTARAIRLVQEARDGEALHALARAERLSEALAASAVSDERREEFERRLWWGYTKVGLRRMETRAFEDALEPLFRALRFAAADAERATETQETIVRALGGLVDARVPAIVGLMNDDPEAARAESRKLYGLLRDSADRGVHGDDLDALVTTVDSLGERIGLART